MPSPLRSSERLRRQLVKDLCQRGVIRSRAVKDAFCAVPREAFVAMVAAEQGLDPVYRDEAIVVKRDPRGMPLSSSSQPALMAEMLERVDARPGDRVLEIGTGTGYNAALLAHIVGTSGRVITLDVDAQLARQARRALREAGYRVSVKVGDGRAGYADGAPYERIIVTACADELATTWGDQLRDGGRLIVPLRLDPDGAAVQIIPAFERAGDLLRSCGLTWGGFMPLHDGDGGWRPPPAVLTASRSSDGQHSSLAELSGAGVAQLSAAAARELLAALLSQPTRPRRQGLTDLSSGRPPLLMLYLLLSIPASRRVAFSTHNRMGIGIMAPRGNDLAIVSVRSPWGPAADTGSGRARWRLDAYGSNAAANRLERLLDTWGAMHRRGHTTLQITGTVRGSRTSLSFDWVSSDQKE